MKLANTFTVAVPVDTAWQVLLDVPRIAPCMPGATLTGQDGDTFTGNVKVKLGPINLTYGGTATITSRDDSTHVAVIQATGKETRGSGTASATITARLEEQDGSTNVAVETDLTITGKPAQFGRGVLAEVSGKLITQFADCLATEITADGRAGATSAAGASDPVTSGDDGSGPGGPRPSGVEDPVAESAPTADARVAPEAIDLLGTAGGPLLKRLAPVLALVAIVVAILLIRRRR